MAKNPERLVRQLYFAPRNPEVAKALKRFADLNSFVSRRNAWLTSVPGSHDIRTDCLPGSGVTGELRKLGWDVTKIGDSQRIVTGTIVEKLVAKPDGEFEPLAEGSTKTPDRIVSHAGIVAIERFSVA